MNIRNLCLCALMGAALHASIDTSYARGNQEKLDKDGDGTLSQAELSAAYAKGEKFRNQMFAFYDKNGDKRISPTEFRNPKQFKKIDADRNGVISHGEYRDWHARTTIGAAQAVDRDGDRKLSGEEVQAAWAKGEAERERKRAEWKEKWENRERIDADQNEVVTEAEARAFYKRGSPRRKQAFRNLDLDNNKRLTPDEFPFPDVFKGADANGNGKITQNEFMNAHSAVTVGILDALDANGDRKLDAADWELLKRRSK